MNIGVEVEPLLVTYNDYMASINHICVIIITLKFHESQK